MSYYSTTRAPAVGGLNGGEISHKVNREVVLMVDSPPSMNVYWKFFCTIGRW